MFRDLLSSIKAAIISSTKRASHKITKTLAAFVKSRKMTYALGAAAAIAALALVLQAIFQFFPAVNRSWRPAEINSLGKRALSNALVAEQGMDPIGTFLVSPGQALTEGTYQVFIQYKASNNAGSSWGILKNMNEALLSGQAMPTNGAGWVRGSFRITSQHLNSPISVRIDYGGSGMMSIEAVSLRGPYFPPSFISGEAFLACLSAALLFLLYIRARKPHFAVRLQKFLKINFYSSLDRYFLRELFPNYLFGLAFFTIMLMCNELFYHAKLYVEYNVPLQQVLMLQLYEIPFILTYSISFGILPAFLLTMGRFSQDSEIIAMKACGVSALRIIRPGVLCGFIIALLAIWFNDNIAVHSFENYVKLRAKIQAQKPVVELKGKAFAEVGGYRISFERLDMDNNVEVLYNIHIVDVAGRKTIEAEKGRIYVDPENPEHYILKFINGNSSQIETNRKGGDRPEASFFVVSFKYMVINTFINLPDETVFQTPETMSIEALRKTILDRSKDSLDKIEAYYQNQEKYKKDIEKYEKEIQDLAKVLKQDDLKVKKEDLEKLIQGAREQIRAADTSIEGIRKGLPVYDMMKLHEKFALPVAAFVFAIISLSLGMFTARSGRGEGLGISIIVMFAYYGLKYGCDILISKFIFPPFMEWGPNCLFFVIGIVLLIIKLKE